MSIVIEEIVFNPLIQVNEAIEEVIIEVSEMQMQGVQGVQGTQGVQGDVGKSAYQTALDGGFVGTESEFNFLLSNVNAETASLAKSPLDYYNTESLDGNIVNDLSSFIDNDTYPTNWIFSSTNTSIPYDGFVSIFGTKLNNSEIGRTVKFYILRQVSGLNYTIIYASENIPAELNGLNTYTPEIGTIEVKENDLIGVKVNFINSSNSIRFQGSGGNDIATSIRYDGAVTQENSYVFTSESNTRRFCVDANIIGRDLVVSKYWGNKPNGYVALDENGNVYNSIGKVQDMQWGGKKIIWVGTSIPALGNPSYPIRTGNFLNANLINESVGSSGIIWDGTRELSLSATIAELTASFPGNESQSYQNKLIGKAADLVVFDHGHNDRLESAGFRLGTIDSMDRTTFYGAFNYVINALYADNVNVKIAFVIPPNRFTSNGTEMTAMDSTRLAILVLADKYGAPVCDLMKLANFNFYTFSTKTIDGTHPTQNSSDDISIILYNFIKGIL